MASLAENNHTIEEFRNDGEFWLDLYLGATGHDQSKATRKSKIQMFLNFVGKQHPLDVTPQDCLRYLKWVETDSKYTYDVKDQRFRMINAFYNLIQKYLSLNNVIYQNPVPCRALFPKFTQRADKIKRETLNESDAQGYLNAEVLVKILKEARLLGDMWLAVFTLAITTGAAPGEVLSVLREDINVFERFFFTGIQDGAMKHNKNNTKPLTFIFPEWAIPIIARWLKIRDASPHKDSKFLFPAPTKTGWVFAQRFAEKAIIIGQKIGNKFNPKDFRSTVITIRRMQGCSPADNYYLQNHKRSTFSDEDNKQPQTSTQEKFYIKSWIVRRRNLYDKYPILQLKDIADI